MTQATAAPEFLALQNVSIRLGETVVFKNTRWTWRQGERWAILGPDGSGKSLLVEAIMGRAALAKGEIVGPIFPEEENSQRPTMVLVSPQTQRELAVQESSFYQLRWHSAMEEGPRTASQFLSQDSVEERNPYEVGAPRGKRRDFLAKRRQYLGWLGLEKLMSRKLIYLSNGEMRKTLLVHALLKSPGLLILEDPYAGLDAATRKILAQVIRHLSSTGWPVLVVTHRPEEIPASTTHLLLVDKHRVIAQGARRSVLNEWQNRFGSDSVSTERRLAPRRTLKSAIRKSPIVELNHISVRGTGRNILHDIHWTWREGECWALFGPNGAGKTTLLNLIQGDHPQAYALDIRLFGRRTDGTHILWQARQRMGWMSPELHQHYPGEWNALDVVCSGFFNSIGLHQACNPRQRRLARQGLMDLGLGKHLQVPFGELSFGQQRLVLLARAAVKNPRLLILDEPCQGLDILQRQTLLNTVDRIVEQTGASLLFVTHHKKEIPRCISHIMRIAKGRIVQTQIMDNG